MSWEVEITHDGMWPLRWEWVVWRTHDGYDLRRGAAMTKDRARRKAVKAKQSMEVEDVKVVYER